MGKRAIGLGVALVALVTIVWVEARPDASDLPTANVQQICGKTVSVENGMVPSDVFRDRRPVRAYVGTGILLRFAGNCDGVEVSPAPNTWLRPISDRWLPTGEITGPHGLVAGVYVARSGHYNFELRHPDGTVTFAKFRIVPYKRSRQRQ